MSGTTSPTACYVDESGIHAPTFDDILTYLVSQTQGIFGADTYLGNDSQDGQLLGVFATAIYDNNSLAVQVYNSYSPATARGVGLASVVKINGLVKSAPTVSTYDLLLTGQAGTTITNGAVTDVNGNRWNIPAGTVIPVGGQVTVTATAAAAGAVAAPAGSVDTANARGRLVTPVLGWQDALSLTDAVVGQVLESDVSLRLRQTTSTMLPSRALIDGQTGAVRDVLGVTRVQPYENNTSITDSNGIPSHSISFVVEGGDAQQIANAIFVKKTPGAGTFGTTSVNVTDAYGVPHVIRFFRPTSVPINIIIHLVALTGYTNAIGQEVIQAILDYINTLPIGSDVFNTKVVGAALNIPLADALTFNLVSVLLSRGAVTPIQQDVVIAFNEAAIAASSNVNLSIP